MVQAVVFAIRSAAGGVAHGALGQASGTLLVRIGAGEAVALNLAPAQVTGYARQGGNLIVALADGREITVAGFFEAPAGLDNTLYLSANGDLTQVTLTDGGGGALRPGYGPNQPWGGYNALDDLRLDGREVATGASPHAATGMAPFVPGLLGGIGGSGLLAAGAIAGGVAVVGGASGGGGGGGNGGRAQPTVDGAALTGTLTTVTPNPQIKVSGSGEPGDTVKVTVGGVVASTVITPAGKWTVTIPGTGLPADGTHEAVVLVTPPAASGRSPVTLDGPGFIIDMTMPAVAVTTGTTSAGHIENRTDHANGVTLAGTGEPGSTIWVDLPNATQTTTVSAAGTWSVTFTTTEIAAGDYSLPVTVTATDPQGNRRVITDTLVLDTIPDPITLGQITGDNVVSYVEQSGGFPVTGTTVAGATVTVSIGTLTQTTTAGLNGVWTVNVAASALPLGEYDATVTASTTDAAGNTATASHPIRVDTSARTSLSGPVATDDIVNASESAAGVALAGTAQPGATVSVAWNGTTLAAPVTAAGTWAVTFPGTVLPSGEANTTITVTATDPVGNTATVSRAVRIDTATAVSVNPGQAGGDDIIAGTEQQAGVALTGRAEAGASVAVTLEGVTRTATALADGSWTVTFARAEIPQGAYATTVAIRATDLAGNTATATHGLSVDTEVRNFAKVSDSLGSDQVLNGTEAGLGLTLAGTAEPGCSVRVKFGTGETRAALVAADGTWSVTVPASEVPPGENTVALTMTATDRIGNVATLTEQVNVDRLVQGFSRAAGTIGTDGVLNANEVAQGLPLGGTVEPGATVVVRLSNGAEKSVVAGVSGQWNVAFAATDLPRGEQTVTAQLTATDRAGNTSSLTESFRVDTVAPDSPGVLGFSRNSSGLRRISTEIGTDSFTFASVDASGTQTPIGARRVDNLIDKESEYRFDDPVPDGSYLVVNATDVSGNTSSTLLIVDNTNATTVNLGRSGLARFDLAAIDLTFAPDARMKITEAQLQSLTGPDNRLIVKGGDDDTVTLTGGLATGQSTVIDGERYAIFTLGTGGGTVLLDDDIRAVI